MHSTRSTRTRLAALAAGTTVALALAGCSGGDAQTGDASDAPVDGELVTYTPEGTAEVDAITWNVFQGEPQTIDPYHGADYTPNMINSNMCETLLAQTPEFEITPNLASSFSNPDPLTWVYELRDDVTFWDGTPMTAEDVAWSLNHSIEDETAFYGYLFSSVESIEATGEHEVTVRLTTPDYLFNEELASYAGVVVQKEFYEENADAVGTPEVGLMCTGPYQFEEWLQGQSISVSRYDDYWNEDVPLQVDSIEFTFVTDDSAITQGLLSGQIDGTYNPPVSALEQLRASAAGSLYSGPAPLEVTLVVANDEGAMGSVDVRRALQMAIDWKGIGEQVYGGGGTPSALQTVPSVFGFAEEELTAYADSVATDGSPRIEEAKALLADVPAEVLDAEISLVVPQQAETQQLGLAIKAAADEIGLNFALDVVPATGYSNYLYDPETRGDTDLLYTQFWPNVPNPLDWLGLTSIPGASFNQSGYAGVEDLYYEAIATADDAERAELVVEIEKRLYEEMMPMFPGITLQNDVWLGERITGAPAAFNYVFSPWASYLGGTGE